MSVPCQRFQCPACRQITDHVLIDAYGRFDRQGEGVLFEVRVYQNPDGSRTWDACPTPEALTYLQGLRIGHAWDEDMREYAESYDVFACPTCGDDMIVDDDVVQEG